MAMLVLVAGEVMAGGVGRVGEGFAFRFGRSDTAEGLIVSSGGLAPDERASGVGGLHGVWELKLLRSYWKRGHTACQGVLLYTSQVQGFRECHKEAHTKVIQNMLAGSDRCLLSDACKMACRWFTAVQANDVGMPPAAIGLGEPRLQEPLLPLNKSLLHILPI